MADKTVAQTSGSWRTDPEVRDEHDRLATIYRQRGLSVLIETASDEIVKLRRTCGAMGDFLREFVRHMDVSDHAADHDGPDEPLCTPDNPLCMDMDARALLARLDGTV